MYMYNAYISEDVFSQKFWWWRQNIFMVSYLQVKKEAIVSSALSESLSASAKESLWLWVKCVQSIAKHATSEKRWKEGTKQYCVIVTLDIINAFNLARWN